MAKELDGLKDETVKVARELIQYFGIKCPHVWKPLVITHVDGTMSAPDNWQECVHCKCWQTKLPRQQLTYNQAP